MLIIGAAALIFFGPDQLPKVARRAGQVMRDVQNTSQSFVREMERAADFPESHHTGADDARPNEYRSYEETMAETVFESEPVRAHDGTREAATVDPHRDDAFGI